MPATLPNNKYGHSGVFNLMIRITGAGSTSSSKIFSLPSLSFLSYKLRNRNPAFMLDHKLSIMTVLEDPLNKSDLLNGFHFAMHLFSYHRWSQNAVKKKWPTRHKPLISAFSTSRKLLFASVSSFSLLSIASAQHILIPSLALSETKSSTFFKTVHHCSTKQSYVFVLSSLQIIGNQTNQNAHRNISILNDVK